MRSTRTSDAAETPTTTGGAHVATQDPQEQGPRPSAGPRPAPHAGARRLWRLVRRRLGGEPEPVVLRHARAGRHDDAGVSDGAVEPRSGRRLERHRLADRARHLPGHAAVRPQAGRRRQRADPLPRHRGAVRRQRGHLHRRQGLHVPSAHRRQVPAAGEPRGHGSGLQVQLRAHDELAARAGHFVLHGRRGRRPVHEREGRGDHGLQGRRRLHGGDHSQGSRPLVPQRLHHGVLRRRPQGVGRKVGQAVQPPPAGHRAVHLREVVAGPRDHAQPQPLLLGVGQAVSRQDRLPALLLTAHRPAQAAERRDRRARRRRAAGRCAARHGRPAVEGARLLPSR